MKLVAETTMGEELTRVAIKAFANNPEVAEEAFDIQYTPGFQGGIQEAVRLAREKVEAASIFYFGAPVRVAPDVESS